MPFNQTGAAAAKSAGTIYLLGGDTFNGDMIKKDKIDRHIIDPGIMDFAWGNGYKNDVWKMKGTEWLVTGDIRVRSQYR